MSEPIKLEPAEWSLLCRVVDAFAVVPFELYERGAAITLVNHGLLDSGSQLGTVLPTFSGIARVRTDREAAAKLERGTMNEESAEVYARMDRAELETIVRAFCLDLQAAVLAGKVEPIGFITIRLSYIAGILNRHELDSACECDREGLEPYRHAATCPVWTNTGSTGPQDSPPCAECGSVNGYHADGCSPEAKRAAQKGRRPEHDAS